MILCSDFLTNINSICSEHGISKGTYGKEQLTPLLHQTAQGMEIKYQAMDKEIRITLAEVGELYVPGGW
jgi:hypothetical protein